MPSLANESREWHMKHTIMSHVKWHWQQQRQRQRRLYFRLKVLLPRICHILHRARPRFFSPFTIGKQEARIVQIAETDSQFLVHRSKRPISMFCTWLISITRHSCGDVNDELFIIYLLFFVLFLSFCAFCSVVKTRRSAVLLRLKYIVVECAVNGRFECTYSPVNQTMSSQLM